MHRAAKYRTYHFNDFIIRLSILVNSLSGLRTFRVAI